MKRKPSENKTKNSSKKQKQASQEVELEQGQQGIVAPKKGDGLAFFVHEGDKYSKLGQHEAAIALYKRALELNQNNSMILYKLGASYDEVGQPGAALTAYTKATELDQTNAVAFNSFKVKKNQEAMIAHTKTTQPEPTTATAFNDLGNVHFGLGQYPEAIASYTKAAVLDPSGQWNSAFFESLGQRLYSKHEDSLAVDSYEKAIELSPSKSLRYANSYIELGACYNMNAEGDDDLDKAIAACLKGIELDKNNCDAYYTLAGIYKRYDKPLEVFRMYLKIIELNQTEEEYCSYEIGDLIFELMEKTHIEKFKLTQLAMKYYGKGGEKGAIKLHDSITSSKPLPEFMQISLTSNTPESITKLAALPELLALGYYYFSRNEYIKALDAFSLFLKHEKQFDVFVNAEVAAGEILELDQNVIREGILQTKSLKESINLRTNQDQHIRDFLDHMKKEYHLSATEFLPQVVDGLRRGLKHTHASIPGILDIILPYIIDGETLKSIQDQDPGEILKLFGESSTIEI